MYMSTSQFGLTVREYHLMTFGLWVDLFEAHKKQSNFTTNRGTYRLSEMPKVESLDLI